MSSTAVSTVSLTLQPGKNNIEHEYNDGNLHKNSFQISSQETKQPEKEISSGIALQSHQAINEIIQQEHALLKEEGTGIDTIDTNSAKRSENEINEEQAKQVQGELENIPEQIPENIANSDVKEEKKQHRLLLDGPGQPYRLDKEGDIPELQTDREILIQVSPLPLNKFQKLSANRRWSPLA